ncbi:cilia- and flagella-associated protein 337 [Synchiropus picturatus]
MLFLCIVSFFNAQQGGKDKMQIPESQENLTNLEVKKVHAFETAPVKAQKNPRLIYWEELPHLRICESSIGDSLAEKLSYEQLKILADALASFSNESRPQALKDAVDGGLNCEDFRKVLQAVMGPEIEDVCVDRFFTEVDIPCKGTITSKQVFAYIHLYSTERVRRHNSKDALLNCHPPFTQCPFNWGKTTVRVVAVYKPPPLHFVSVSRGGQLTVWNNRLEYPKSFELARKQSKSDPAAAKGSITDAVYMANVNLIAISTECRDLRFVNVASTNIFEDVMLYGFHNVLSTLCYWYDSKNPDNPSLLLMGDVEGGVHLMKLLHPSEGVFNIINAKVSQSEGIYFPNISGEHHNMVSCQYIPNIHHETINRLMFEPSTNIIRSSSESDITSVVSMDIYQKERPSVWKIKQGVTCFDYNASLRLMVTGGCDRVIRVWNPFITESPLAKMEGHCTSVLDVAIYEPVKQIFSYSSDSELRVWDITSQKCLKTVFLHFPCLQPLCIPEHCNFPFLLMSPPLSDGTLPNLVVGCKDDLVLIPLAEEDAAYEGCLADEGKATLLCAEYNPTLRQVVTGHSDSSLSVWDVVTGVRQLQVRNAHGVVAITCMALDHSHRRLITGADNGTIKVWSLLNGLNLIKLEPAIHTEVAGLTCLDDDKLLAIGGDKQIIQYDISIAKDLDIIISAEKSWKASCVHKADILALCHSSSLGLIATASRDGEVIIWRTETQEPIIHLRRHAQTEPMPSVDSLLFLQHRASKSWLKHDAVLISSHSGSLYFWSVSAVPHRYTHFYAPEEPGACVLSLSSDQAKNSLLISGDTSGCLQIWDISQYALGIGSKPICAQPPLQKSWLAHNSGLRSVEVLVVEETRFILAASETGAVGVWTDEGVHVGSFGHGATWDIYDPATYQSNKIIQEEEECEEELSEDKGKEGSSDGETSGEEGSEEN